MVGGYVGGPVTSLFLLGVLTRRGQFWGWLIAACVITIPLQIYIQNFTDTHWVFYAPLATVICLLVSYPISLMVAAATRLEMAPREYTIWRRSA